MRPVEARPTKMPELAWLYEVQETRQPLSDLCPIWVRHETIYSGPPIPHPECHPYCELNVLLEGIGTAFIENEELHPEPGDLMLMGPGVPHWGTTDVHPVRYVTLYFLPTVLIEAGPESDGSKILRRFIAKQPPRDRFVRPPARLRSRLIRLFEQIVTEFDGKKFGRAIKLRALLMDLLVELLRWEQDQGRTVPDPEMEVDWRPIYKALGYLREHYAEQVYARNVARAAGVSESLLNILFHHALGMSWVKYLQGYRIHRAAALLSEPGHGVTQAAFAVGFESLSHFNKVFRRFMGRSPKHYGKKLTSRR